MTDTAAESFDYNTPFTPARPKKKRKNRIGLVPIPPQVALERTIQELTAGGWMLECAQLVRESASSIFSHLSNPRQVLCLGLGSPSSSRDARAQLAFLLELCDAISIDRSQVLAFDPVFTKEDEELLDAAKVQRSSENRIAAYTLSEPTIVFMPHCDLNLYENLLRKNWSRDQLRNTLLIANDLSEYLDSHPSHKLSVQSPCVSRFAHVTVSRPLPRCPSHSTAFNNIAIQFVRSEVLMSVEDVFWEITRHSESVETGVSSQ